MAAVSIGARRASTRRRDARRMNGMAAAPGDG
ncbi:hypothetical protein M218_03800 [Burkholderia pseudomallei MSHR338]|nr:hypothetical protein M218_03800 [Burkholderia pseudomallei MSHR338]